VDKNFLDDKEQNDKEKLLPRKTSLDSKFGPKSSPPAPEPVTNISTTFIA
jgi:hypothetical protein